MFVSAKLQSSRGPDASSCACLLHLNAAFSVGAGEGAHFRRQDQEEAPGSHSLCHWPDAVALPKYAVRLLKIQTGFSKMVQPCGVVLPSNQPSYSPEVRVL